MFPSPRPFCLCGPGWLCRSPGPFCSLSQVPAAQVEAAACSCSLISPAPALEGRVLERSGPGLRERAGSQPSFWPLAGGRGLHLWPLTQGSADTALIHVSPILEGS